jgi:hypothetical protein
MSSESLFPLREGSSRLSAGRLDILLFSSCSGWSRQTTGGVVALLLSLGGGEAFLNFSQFGAMRLENNSDINEYGVLGTGLGPLRDDPQFKRQRYGAFTCLMVNFVLIVVLFLLYANIETKKTIQVFHLPDPPLTLPSSYSFCLSLP